MIWGYCIPRSRRETSSSATCAKVTIGLVVGLLVLCLGPKLLRGKINIDRLFLDEDTYIYASIYPNYPQHL